MVMLLNDCDLSWGIMWGNIPSNFRCSAAILRCFSFLAWRKATQRQTMVEGRDRGDGEDFLTEIQPYEL